MVAPNTQLTDAQAQRLLDSLDAMTAAESLSDAALADAAIHVLVTHLTDPSYAVISELINRFEARAGIVRNEETGEIVVAEEE